MIFRDEPIEELWRRYRDDQDVHLRNELINRYAHLVKIHAGRLARRLSSQVTPDEIASAAFDGLMAAVESYDPDRQVMFETYASKRIIGAVHDWLRAIDPQSRTMRDFDKKRDLAMTLASSDVGCQASGFEVAEHMGMTLGQYASRIARIRSTSHVSLNASDEFGKYGRSSIGDQIPDERQASPSRGVERDMLRTYITRGLHAQERHVLTLYYYDNLTMAEVGTVMGLSESRVSQLHAKILKRLRARFGSRQAAYAVL